ncbi:hypothetical protein LTR10_001905 [Elasticomyces elasticus]|nr:hypothetical protein LTR10_001905 [Elasticomyces elasticus]KAK4975405.1 Mitochondrial import inner membrane translocase subunit tim8 [Elasticomyces elasticus]
MAIKNRAPTLWCMFLLLLVLFTTTTFSREVTQDISVHDFQDGLQAAANGTFKLPEQSFGQPDTVEKIGDPTETTTSAPVTPFPDTPRPISPYPTAFTNARDKGGDFLILLKCANAIQSPFVQRESLFDNGWCTLGFPPRIEPPSPVPIPYGIGDEDAAIFKQLGISSEKDDNPYYNWIHGKTWTYSDKTKNQNPQGFTELTYGDIGPKQEYGLTKATYGNQFNPKAGLIMCMINYSPQFKISTAKNAVVPQDIGPAPPLSKMSDVLWFQWKDAVAARGGSLGNIKYFWPHNIVDKDSKAIMDAIAGIPGNEIIDYPGKTYSMTAPILSVERQIAQALLGSPNGVAVAFFLAQHREEIGTWKTVSKVQLFKTDSWGGRVERHMLFSIVDVEK